MFPEKLTLKVTDKSIKEYLRLAHALGIEESDWKYEWGDGGRVTFSFRSDELRETFYACYLLLQ